MKKVVSVFPGLGKTYVYQNQEKLNLKVEDSDSSKYHWIFGDNGEQEENPRFPINYIEHIKELIKDESIDYIFVSTHKEVRDALKANGIEYTLIFPSPMIKKIMLKRYKERENTQQFINKMDSSFLEFYNDLKEDTGTEDKIIVTEDFYLSDLI